MSFGLSSCTDLLLQFFIHKVTRRALWLVAITTVQMVDGVVQLMISVRILGLENFGVLAIIMGTSSLFYGLVRIPNHDTITTYVPRSMEGTFDTTSLTIQRLVFCTAQGLAFFAYGFLALFSLMAYEFIGLEQIHVQSFLVYGLAGLFLATRMESLAVLQTSGRLYLGLIAVSVGMLVRAVALLIVWQQNGGLFSVVLAIVAGAGITGIGLFMAVLLCRRENSSGLPRAPLTSLSRDIFRFQALAFIREKILILHENLPLALLGVLAEPIQAGIYRAALQLLAPILGLLSMLVWSVQLEYSQRWRGEHDNNLGKLPWRATLLLTGLATIGYGLFVILHPWIVHIILGSRYENISGLLLIMSMGFFIATCISVLVVLPVAIGKMRPVLMWTTVAFLAQLLVLLLALPRYQAQGAAWAFTIFHLVFMIMIAPFAVAILRQTGKEVEVLFSPCDRR